MGSLSPSRELTGNHTIQFEGGRDATLDEVRAAWRGSRGDPRQRGPRESMTRHGPASTPTAH
jgi:hypothetical protein